MEHNKTEQERTNARVEMATLWLSLLNESKSEREISQIKSRIAELNERLLTKRDEDGTEVEWDRFLRFNKKEIAKMPKKYQKVFRYQEYHANVYLRADGIFAIRCRKPATLGINIEVYSRDLAEAKKKFIEKLHELEKPEQETETTKTELMSEYVELYLKLNARKIVSSSIKHKELTYRNHILPYIKGLKVSEVRASKCYEILNRLIDAGKSRTAEDVKSILNQAFVLAIGDDVIKKNPLDFVEYTKHERENGVRLDDETIRIIMNATEESAYDTALKVSILTGIRPVELKSAKLHGKEWVEVTNAKQPKGKVNYRKIPLTPYSYKIVARMLRNKCGFDEKNLSAHFRKLYASRGKRYCKKDYTLYDCRHTFTSLCAENGILKPCIDLWLNHKNGGMTERVYTHVSDAIQISEMQKFKLPET